MPAKEEKIIVPALGESVTEATIGRWVIKAGEAVAQDALLVELETEKVTLEVNARAAGVMKEIRALEGATVKVGDVIALMTLGDEKPAPKAAAVSSSPAQQKEAAPETVNFKIPWPDTETLSPAVRKLVQEHALDPASLKATGKGGRVTKEDVLGFLKQTPSDVKSNEKAPNETGRGEERVRMSRLRQTIAGRLKEAQNTAAILTTFNEIDMHKVMELRERLKDKFEKKYAAKLGFMSFFVKACVQALKEIPAINAEIDGDEIVYKNYYDIGVAVGAPQGLVVPIVRDAEGLSFAEVEKTIADLALKAREGKLTVKDLTGGTFTISNGGVYGSLMSTPILNPPQSGILGMHKIEKRPVVVADKVEIRPMMYIALSYDHRLVDGAQAVAFLVRIKECLEDPERMLLSV